MESEFKDLNFDKYIYVKNMRSIAGHFTKNNRCGIYILHFENSEYYVGLAIDVVNRYAQHRLNHLDIEYISFKEIAKSKLAEIEKLTVYELENRKKALRNINIVSIVIGDTDLDLVVSKDEQEKWMNYELPFESIETERFEYPEHRRKYTKKFEKLKLNPLFANCCEILQHYIYFTTPFPKKTEYSFWSCSCLPSSDKAL
jgi:predicted GIY-YIG superfamily endonuclease